MSKHENEKEELLDIIFAMEQEFAEAENSARREFQDIRDEIKTHNAEEFSFLRVKLDGRISQMEREFEQANNSYTSTTEQQITRLKQMTFQDEQNTKTIDLNNRKLKRLHKSLNHWRTKMANNVRECEQRNKALKEVLLIEI